MARLKKKKDPEGRMPLVEHIRELRSRILWSLLGILIGTVVAWIFYDPIFTFMAQPLADLREQGRQAELNFETISAAFDLKLRITMFAGFILASPWWLYQTWAYLAPALHRKEKAYVLIFTFAGIVLFAIGVGMGLLIMPHAVQVLTSFAPSQSEMLMKANLYFSFYMRLVIVFGISMLVPLAMVGLNQLNILRATTMMKTWRWAVAVAFIFAAIANPLPDPWTMTFQALFLVALYFLAIGVCFLHDKRWDRKQARIEAELDAALATHEDDAS
ncbi:MAG: twin-arginine translocase subunit TatC [Actinomycetaceae bacterium]|nr:twin-arginine translocase subunit TatC [Actinomycetaceae bacterium]